MTFTEEKKDIFEYQDTWGEEPFYYAHCISADYALGAGIAKEFKKRFKLNNNNLIAGKVSPSLSIVSNVFNLITKKLYWQKPTYQSLQDSLDSMKKSSIALGVKKLIMPKIGCGLDRLSWGTVRKMIKDTFKDTDIDIIICYI